MEKALQYHSPEFKMIPYTSVDVITTSEEIVTPPWGGEEVTNPFIGL